MLLRQHGGYAGVSDDELLRLPYARLLQELRLAGEARKAQEQSEWRRAAFIGWQVSRTVGGSMGVKVPPFNVWLGMFGLQERPTISASERQRDIERSHAIAARLDEAFNQRGVVKA